MELAHSISKATDREVDALSRYIANEVVYEHDDTNDDGQLNITPDGIAAAMRAWAYMQQHQADGDA